MAAKPDHHEGIIQSAVELARKTDSHKIFLFLNTAPECRWFQKNERCDVDDVVLVLPRDLKAPVQELEKDGLPVIRNWSGNQSRFSRIKYAFLHGVMRGIIDTSSRVVCVLGPWGSEHLDTITIHDLALSWSQDFPFEPKGLVAKRSFSTVLAIVDIALDIGAMGREGKAVGTTFVVGDSENVLKSSHQAVFNPFKGYPKKERYINRPEVVESIKELAQLDGAFVITSSGVVEAAGRHLDTEGSSMNKQLRGLGSRHRAAAGITRKTKAVAVVVSESTGRVTIFDGGKVSSTLEPVISRRLV